MVYAKPLKSSCAVVEITIEQHTVRRCIMSRIALRCLGMRRRLV